MQRWIEVSSYTTIISLPKKSVFFETDCYGRGLWWNVCLKEQSSSLQIGVEVIDILCVQWGVVIYFQGDTQSVRLKNNALKIRQNKRTLPPDTIPSTMSIPKIKSDNL